MAAGAITTAKIAARTITADKIVSGAITSTEINVSNLVSDGLIGANKLTASNINVDSLFAQTITASGSIQSNNFYHTSGNYSARGIKLVMSTGQIISKKFAIDSSGNAYFAGDISGASISGSSISGGTISGSSISGGSISSTKTNIVNGIAYQEATEVTNGRIKNSGYNNGTERNATISSGIVFLERKDGAYETTMEAERFVISKKNPNGSYGGVFSVSADSGSLSTNLNATFEGNMEIKGTLKHVGMVDLRDSYDVFGEVTGTWKDGSKHDVLFMDKTGLSTYLGWVGSSSYKTNLIFRGQSVRLGSTSGTTVTSDERLKKSFQPLDRYDGFFRSLEPCAFKYKDGASGRYHCGFKAQQVLAALEANGLTSQDFAGFVKFPVSRDSEEYHGYEEEYGIIYTEFVPLLVHEAQRARAEFESYKKVCIERMASMERSLSGLKEAFREALRKLERKEAT